MGFVYKNKLKTFVTQSSKQTNVQQRGFVNKEENIKRGKYKKRKKLRKNENREDILIYNETISDYWEEILLPEIKL